MTPGSHPASAKATTPIRAIRAHCLECANTSFEVLHCHLVKCPLHRYRLGTNPSINRKPLSPEQAEARRELGRALGAKRRLRRLAVDK